MPKLMRITLKILLVLLTILIAACAILLIYRKIHQVGADNRSKEIVAQGGISEFREYELNGVRQHIVVETKDAANPVVLFLHGGPGLATPYGASSRGLYPEITEHVTAVFWDQRGAGKSLPYTDVPRLTIRQFVDDVLILSESLKEEFNQERIYIIAISWGTVPALRAVAERPDLYHGYFAQGQVTNVVKSEQSDYQRLMEHANEKDKQTLRGIGEPPYASIMSSDYQIFSDISDRTTSEGLVKPDLFALVSGVLFSPDYSLSDIYDTIFRAQSLNFTQSGLIDEMYTLDFNTEITQIDVPVYIFNGRYDTAVPLEVTQEYLELLSAPSKELIILEQSGHIPSPDDIASIINTMIDKIV